MTRADARASPAQEPWDGFYHDTAKDEKHPMELDVAVCVDGTVEGSGADVAGKFVLSGRLMNADEDKENVSNASPPEGTTHVLRVEKHYFEDRFGRTRQWVVSATCPSADGQSFRGKPHHGDRPIHGGELVFERPTV